MGTIRPGKGSQKGFLRGSWGVIGGFLGGSWASNSKETTLRPPKTSPRPCKAPPGPSQDPPRSPQAAPRPSGTFPGPPSGPPLGPSQDLHTTLDKTTQGHPRDPSATSHQRLLTPSDSCQRNHTIALVSATLDITQHLAWLQSHLTTAQGWYYKHIVAKASYATLFE